MTGMTINNEVAQRMDAAKVVASMALGGIFEDAVNATVFIPSDLVPTMATDKWFRCYWSPDFVARHTVVEVAGVIIHELLHPLSQHHERCCGRHAEAWNIAADAEINDDLFEVVALPEGVILPTALGCEDGLFAEDYYSALADRNRSGDGDGGGRPQKRRRKKDNQGGQGGQGQGGEEGEGEGKDQGGSGGGGEGKKKKKGGGGGGDGDDGGKHRVPHHDCGSGCGGDPRPWEAPAPGEPGAPRGLDSDEARELRRQVAQKIHRASQSRGDIPGGLKRWAEGVVPTEVPWQQVLRRYLTANSYTSMREVSYRRTSRRYEVPPFFFPGREARGGQVAVCLDTSGSMTDEYLAKALGEIEAICRVVGEVTFLAVDAEVGAVCKAHTWRDAAKNLTGGGGTDMRVGIEAACKLQPRPNAVVVVTDGYTPWSESRPSVPVVVCLVGGADPNSVPSWARVVQVKNKEGKRGEGDA